MNTDFIRANSTEAYDLSQCFRLARRRSFSLLRPAAGRRPEIMKLLSSVEEAARSPEFAGELLARTYFLQFMIEINRMAETDDTEKDATAYKSDPKMEELMGFINENLRGDLSLDRLSQEFYISKSHLMHKFKSVAGCTAHGYILQKRLILAADLIKNGMPVTEACEQSGFSDYTAFLKAFKKMFGTTPKMMA
jgi:AraC-like DNA-binding protein